VQHIRFSVIAARVLQGLALPFLVVGAGLGWFASLIDDEDDEAALEEREIRKFDRHKDNGGKLLRSLGRSGQI
jgi:hypothetical protein